MSLGPHSTKSFFVELQRTRSREAWAEFLQQYSGVIFAACESTVSHHEYAADCFLFACEQLSKDGFRRLMKFRADGPASLETWLRVVVRNLSLDWTRKQFGRRRPFESVARLPRLEVEVFRHRYEQGFSLDETFLCLSPAFPGLTIERLRETERSVENSMSSRQRWLLATQRARQQLTSRSDIEPAEQREGVAGDPPDPRPTPEALIARKEEMRRLRTALAELSREQQLLIRMRFGQDLSLEQIAALTGLGDAQRVHRNLAHAVASLKKKFHKKSGNVASPSV